MLSTRKARSGFGPSSPFVGNGEEDGNMIFGVTKLLRELIQVDGLLGEGVA